MLFDITQDDESLTSHSGLALIGLLGLGQPVFAAIEPFHAEIKSKLDLERLPSGKFATNALVQLLGRVAYNGLRLCGQESRRDEGLPPADRAPWRKPVSRRRLLSVIQDLMYMASQVITHMRRAGLSFGKGNPW